MCLLFFFFFFQAEDGIRDVAVTGVQTCALPILQQAGLQAYLDKLGFQTVGYGCTTCIGNSGPLDPRIEDVVISNDLIAARSEERRVGKECRSRWWPDD